VTITVRDARSSRDDREWIRSVYRDYLSELSVAKSGLFPALGEWDARESEFLAGWFSDLRAFPFVILADGGRVGFALVTRTIGAADGVRSHRLSEFFVVRAARRRGAGRDAARLIFHRFAGDWEIVEDDQNRSALRFWRRVLSDLTDGRYQESHTGGEVRHTFRVDARS
jgi:predicted acetyltransferase